MVKKHCRLVEGKKSHECTVCNDFQGSRKMKDGERCSTRYERAFRNERVC